MDLRHPALLRRDDSLLVVIDCQERLWKVIHDRELLENRLAILLRGAAELRVPVLVTEQNPRGLGPTLPSLRALAPEAPVVAKASFSCGGDEGFRGAVRESERGTLVLVGVEAHICVLQTAFDALALGYRVHVVADAVGTRLPETKAIGLARMDRAGASVTCVESVLFEWMGRCDVPEFRRVAELLK